jgi:predicted tellurium resistance membrane protein TerC
VVSVEPWPIVVAGIALTILGLVLAVALLARPDRRTASLSAVAAVVGIVLAAGLGWRGHPSSVVLAAVAAAILAGSLLLRRVTNRGPAGSDR